MPLHIIEQDITTMKVDAIVNSTNHYMYGFSGVDELIHEIGGEEFNKECEKLVGVCMPGEAVYTKAYNLSCKYIIHTISIGWRGGISGETAILKSCYRSSLRLSDKLGLKSVAFPLISAGNNGCPVSSALSCAVTSISEHFSLYNDEMDVYLVLFGSVVKRIAETMYGDLDNFVNENLRHETKLKRDKPISKTLDEFLATENESFVDMLYRFMEERGIKKNSELYMKAGVSKATFSKLVSGKSQKPSLETAVGLAMALELSWKDAEKFFASVGIALSDSSKYDLIVKYFIQTGNYNIWDLDVQLVKNDYKAILGCE